MKTLRNKISGFTPLDRRSRHLMGFTLIELLVVISIIALLSSIVLTSLNSARAKARDAKKREEIHSIQAALYLYYDANGRMPTQHDPNADSDTQANFLDDLITAGFLKTKPVSPTSPTTPYQYYDYGAGNTIGALIVTSLEAATAQAAPYPGTCRPWGAGVPNWCTQDVTKSYCVCNPY